MKKCTRVGCHNEIEDHKEFCDDCLQDGMETLRRPICKRIGCVEPSVKDGNLCTKHLAEHLQELNSFEKKDDNKPRMELIDPDYMIGVAQVLTFGAEKYEANNWKKATEEDLERIKGAQLRHIMAYNSGELIDPESGLNHQYHISFGCMVLAYFNRHNKEHEKQGSLCLDK